MMQKRKRKKEKVKKKEKMKRKEGRKAVSKLYFLGNQCNAMHI